MVEVVVGLVGVVAFAATPPDERPTNVDVAGLSTPVFGLLVRVRAEAGAVDNVFGTIVVFGLAAAAVVVAGFVVVLHAKGNALVEIDVGKERNN